MAIKVSKKCIDMLNLIHVTQKYNVIVLPNTEQNQKFHLRPPDNKSHPLN